MSILSVHWPQQHYSVLCFCVAFVRLYPLLSVRHDLFLLTFGCTIADKQHVRQAVLSATKPSFPSSSSGCFVLPHQINPSIIFKGRSKPMASDGAQSWGPNPQIGSECIVVLTTTSLGEWFVVLDEWLGPLQSWAFCWEGGGESGLTHYPPLSHTPLPVSSRWQWLPRS